MCLGRAVEVRGSAFIFEQIKSQSAAPPLASLTEFDIKLSEETFIPFFVLNIFIYQNAFTL